MLALITSSIFVVNSPLDLSDTNPGDGVCRTAANNCTLRAAIEEANAYTDFDIITFDASITRAVLDTTIDIKNQLLIKGKPSVDTIICGFSDSRCIWNDWGNTLTIDSLYIEAQGIGINNGGELFIRNSQVNSTGYGILSWGGRIDVRRTRIISKRVGILLSGSNDRDDIIGSYIEGDSGAISIYYEADDISPDSIANDTLISNLSYACITMNFNGRKSHLSENLFQCASEGIVVVDNAIGQESPESLMIRNNRFNIPSSKYAMVIDGCNRCFLIGNLLESGGGFIIFKNSRAGIIDSNQVVNDAGLGSLIYIENSDSNLIRWNRLVFSSLKSETGGISLVADSDSNIVAYNMIRNLEWAGLTVMDSSSYNVFIQDTVINTAGVSLRRHWKGTYAFPIYLDTAYSGAIGTDNVFDGMYIISPWAGFSVAGMDSTIIQNSIIEVEQPWAIGILNAGTPLVVNSNTIRINSIGTGYGISLEYYYDEDATPNSWSDDLLPRIYAKSNTIDGFVCGIRAIDMDTSTIKLDTVANGNTFLQYKRKGCYYMPVVVQTINQNTGNPDTTNIDSVYIIAENGTGGSSELTYINPDEALWSKHWSGTPTVYRDSLNTYFPVEIMYYDSNLNFRSYNPHLVRLLGPKKRVEDYTLHITRQSPHATTPDGRWIVIEVQYDPDILPISTDESKQIPVFKNTKVYSISGRFMGDNLKELPPGIYIIREERGRARRIVKLR